MKYYVSPELKITELMVCDVLTGSGQLDNGGVENPEQMGRFGSLNLF